MTNQAFERHRIFTQFLGYFKFRRIKPNYNMKKINRYDTLIIGQSIKNMLLFFYAEAIIEHI